MPFKLCSIVQLFNLKNQSDIQLQQVIMSEQVKSILDKAKRLHYELKIESLQLAQHLDYIKTKACEKPKFVPCGGCLGSKTDVNPAFMRAFHAFTQAQRADFYMKSVRITKELIDNRGELPSTLPDGNRSCTWNFFNQSEKQWQTKSIQINFSKLVIKFKSTKEEIDLHNYILRASKKKDKQKKILALQSIQALQLPQTIRLSNYKQNFDEFNKFLISMIDEGIKQNLLRLAMIEPRGLKSHASLKLSKKQERQSPLNQIDEIVSRNSFVAIKIPQDQPQLQNKVSNFPLRRSSKDSPETEYQKFKTKLINSLTNQQNLQVYRKNVFINIKQNRVRKVFQYRQQDALLPLQWFSDNLMLNSSFRRWKKSLKDSRALSYNKQSQTKIFYEKHQFKDQTTVSYIYKREKMQNGQNCLYFIDVPVSDESNYQPVNGKVEYVIWKIDKSADRLIITVQGKLIHGRAKMGYPSIQLSDEFLGEMDYICTNLTMTLDNYSNFNINSIMFEEEYLSQIDNFNDVEESETFYSIDEEQNDVDKERGKVSEKLTPIQTPQKQRNNERSDQYFFTFKVLNKSDYLSQPDADKLLKFKHPQIPFPKGKPKQKYPIKEGNHPYFQNQFEINKQGEMVSINQAKLNAQSSVLKSVLKTIGKNLFSGKSILSISLPVTVFSVESNLSLICKSYAYAPTLLEKAAQQKDPVQRVKYIAAFATTTTVAYLQMDKPFNPILGQTFQAIFDGCLVYGQQIAHHPPISATYMVGRGYKLYGSFEAKVNMGLNSATGSNEGVLRIQFDNPKGKKDIVRVTFPPGEVTGLTIGVRKVAATQKSYIYDQSNRVYLELTFNKHKGVTQYCKFYDGVQGKIVKLNPDFDIKKLGNMNKKFITQQYGIVSGRWTGEIYYQDELVFNTWTDMAHQYEKYPCPLQSDAYFRKDLLLRVQENYEAAQEAKQELEKIQRRDRDLRKKYTGKSH